MLPYFSNLETVESLSILVNGHIVGIQMFFFLRIPIFFACGSGKNETQSTSFLLSTKNEVSVQPKWVIRMSDNEFDFYKTPL